MEDKKCYPLDMVNLIGDRFPEFWEYAEKLRSSKNTGTPQWDKDLCYIPIALAIEYAEKNKNKGSLNSRAILHPEIFEEYARVFNTKIDLVDLPPTFYAEIMAEVAPWRLHKQIYNFAPEMEKILFEQAEDCKIPVEILKNLPFPCLYIEINTEDFAKGFFFSFENDIQTNEIEIRFLFLEEHDDKILPLACPIHIIDNGTLSDGLEKTMNKIYENANCSGASKEVIEDIMKLQNDVFERIKKCLQLILYICSQNKEMEEDEIQKRIYRKPSSSRYIKDKYREVQKWNMGVETSERIRKLARNSVRYQYSKEEHREGSSKSPHVRRGHWHHFWTGSRKGERKLILKWVAPMFINADDNKNIKITRNIIQ